MAVDPEDRVFESEMSRREQDLSVILGDRTLEHFRDDISEIYCERVDHSAATYYELGEWIRAGRQGLEITRQKWDSFDAGLSVLDVGDAVLTLVVGAVVTFAAQSMGVATMSSFAIGLVVSVVLTLLKTGLAFTQALINQIAYPPRTLHSRLENEELYFRAAWNKAITGSNQTLIGLLLLGIVSAPNKRGYEIGLKAVEWYADRKAP